MDKRTLRAYQLGLDTIPRQRIKRAEPPRYCHTCGKKLVRRVYMGSAHPKSPAVSKTESKADFFARHFCDTLCRATCRSFLLATVPPSRFR